MADPRPGDFSVRPGTPADLLACQAIGAALPEYFTPVGLAQMAYDLTAHTVLVGELAGTILGFLVAERKAAQVAEILWLAVRPDAQGQGLGSVLVNVLTAQARNEGVSVLEVKTLAATVESPHYARTRNFYERLGFALLEEIDPYPGWSVGNPCAIYIKALERAQ